MYPLMFSLKNKRLLFVGGGKVAFRKISSLIIEDPEITVISPDILEDILNISYDKIEFIKRDFADMDVSGYDYVFACTDNKDLNIRIAAVSKISGIPVNVASAPELCDFHMPAVIYKDDFMISFSTNGKDPAKSAELKSLLQKFLHKNNYF